MDRLTLSIFYQCHYVSDIKRHYQGALDIATVLSQEKCYEKPGASTTVLTRKPLDYYTLLLQVKGKYDSAREWGALVTRGVPSWAGVSTLPIILSIRTRYEVHTILEQEQLS